MSNGWDTTNTPFTGGDTVIITTAAKTYNSALLNFAPPGWVQFLDQDANQEVAIPLNLVLLVVQIPEAK
jgi:hypothetical protein